MEIHICSNIVIFSLGSKRLEFELAKWGFFVVSVIFPQEKAKLWDVFREDTFLPVSFLLEHWNWVQAAQQGNYNFKKYGGGHYNGMNS